MIVSNTSPIINLAAINQLDILNKLYNSIIIPEAVYHEIVVIGSGKPGSGEVLKSEWIVTQKVSNKLLVKALELEIDKGEAEAIALSAELNANLLLIDERIGRSIANRFNLNYVGLLGLLIEAKHRGIIKNIKPLLDELKIKGGFWIKDKLYFRILEKTNEL